MAKASVVLGKARIRTRKQITLPDSVMQALHLKEGSEIAFKLVNGFIQIDTGKPSKIPADETYAFTPEWQASLKRALAQVKAGQVYTFKSPEEALKFAKKIFPKGKL